MHNTETGGPNEVEFPLDSAKIHPRKNGYGEHSFMINHVLREHSAATGKPHLTRTEGISNELIDALVAFLSPFEQNITMLEGEKYSTLPFAAYAIGEFLDLCKENPNDCEVIVFNIQFAIILELERLSMTPGLYF
ncbi:Lutropin subunit beta, partial [Frankliniella fusca]